MTLPNSSITLPGTGEVVATQTIGSNKYQAMLAVDDSGHIQQTVPTYSWWVPGSAVGASKLYASMHNASGSGRIIEIRGMWAIPKSDVAISGTIGVEIGLYRTSAAPTGGTAYTYNGGTASTSHVITPWDSTNLDLSTVTQITARSVPTGGATISALWWAQYVSTEETNAGTYVCSFTNMLPVGTMNQRITLREGQGILMKQGTVSGAGSMAFLTLFTVV